ncbi:MAG: glycosyltransferase family 4 protein [Acidobacteriota bacterium]|nr:glycosyltransferase family 4 protein [Acidobacteriota bacterium]
MRIGLDGIPLASLWTGIGHYTSELAHNLARIAPANDIELISPVPILASVNADGVTDQEGELPANLRVVRTGTHLFWWTVGLPIHLRQASLSLFHGTNYDVPLWGRVKKVVTIHDLSPLLHPETHPDNLVRRARRRLPLMAKASTMIITATESVKREICEHLGVEDGKVAVTPYAPRRNFRPLPPEQTVEVRKRLNIADDFLLFVGTIEPRKNLITLVRAFDEILRTTTWRPQLVIAGKEGWLSEELFSYIQQSSVAEHIRFIGYVSDPDLRGLYSSCRMCVYPSLYEGFGLPPLEAMACGAPVITSRIPSIVETVGTAASFVSPTDVEGLAQAITQLLYDENTRNHFASAGIRRAAEFTWEKTARATLDVYEEALKRNKSS